jgi:hypothetical protein
MTTASYQQILEVLGDVDPLFVNRIEATGASIDEVNEALGQVEGDEFGEERCADSSPRVAEVRAVLEEIFDDPQDEPQEGAWVSADAM